MIARDYTLHTMDSLWLFFFFFNSLFLFCLSPSSFAPRLNAIVAAECREFLRVELPVALWGVGQALRLFAGDK